MLQPEFASFHRGFHLAATRIRAPAFSVLKGWIYLQRCENSLVCKVTYAVVLNNCTAGWNVIWNFHFSPSSLISEGKTQKSLKLPSDSSPAKVPKGHFMLIMSFGSLADFQFSLPNDVLSRGNYLLVFISKNSTDLARCCKMKLHSGK